MSFSNRDRSFKQVRTLGTQKFRVLLSYQIGTGSCPVQCCGATFAKHITGPGTGYIIFLLLHNTVPVPTGTYMVPVQKDISRSRVSFSLSGAQAAPAL
jgi:hypothetical protein